MSLSDDGFTVVRGVFSVDECAGIRDASDRILRLARGRSFRDRYGNVRFFNAADPALGECLRSVIWCGLLDDRLEALRRDPRLLEIVRPMVGDTLRQVTNQLHYKLAGSRTSFQLHADRSSRERDQGREIRNLDACFWQTAIVAERMGPENGGVYFVPGSHRWSGETAYAQAAERGRRPEADFEETMPDGCVPVEADAGDVVVWHGSTVHGSAVSHAASGNRVLYVNGYVRASDCLRGYWAFIKGNPVPLPSIDTPMLVYGEPEFEAFALERGRALREEYGG